MRKPPPLAFFKALFEDLQPEELQARFLTALLEFQGVERGSIWVKEGRHFVCKEAAGRESERIRGMTISPSRESIVGWVIRKGERTIAEPGRDRRHYAGIEDGMVEKSSLILCFPLVLSDGSVYGAVQIIDTSAGGRRLKLDRDYLELLQGLVTIGGLALSNSLRFAHQIAENLELRRALDEARLPLSMIGQSPAFLEVMRNVETYARTDFPVLVTGESGTGKDLVSAEIHRRSPRAAKPFLTQNCSAIPETLLESELFGYRKGAFTGADRDKVGLFEAAHGGTVFLDEIGDMPVALQARILRVVQTGEVKPLGGTDSRRVDVRMISATNRDLEKAVASGQFREDLFYRLNVLPLKVPALRERPSDIPPLLRHFAQKYARTLGEPVKELEPEVLAWLTRYPWPGNVREMENLVRLLLTTVPGGTIRTVDLPAPHAGGIDAAADRKTDPGGGADVSARLTDLTWEQMERRYVESLLERCRWNVTRAAGLAGVKRTTFRARMERLGIRRDRSSEEGTGSE